MREQSNLIIHQLQTGAMVSIQGIERHVGPDEEGSRIALKTSQTHGIGTHYVQFRLLAHGRRIIGRLHVIVMTEVRIILCPRSKWNESQQNQQREESSKHNEITKISPDYCLTHFFRRSFSASKGLMQRQKKNVECRNAALYIPYY